MNLEFDPQAIEDLRYLKKYEPKNAKRVIQLLKDIKKTPFTGLGKPESLRYGLSGKWSRRINQKDRLVYEIKRDTIIVFQCRYHY